MRVAFPSGAAAATPAAEWLIQRAKARRARCNARPGGTTDTLQRIGKRATAAKAVDAAPNPPPTKSIWMNGKLVPYADAKIHFMAAGNHYGLNFFEGLRCYATERGPAIFRLQDHMRRFEQTANILGYEGLRYTTDELAAAAKLTVADNGIGECYIRPLAYLAEGGHGLSILGTTPDVGIAVWEWKDFLGPEAREKGIRAMVSSYTRLHPNASMTKAKVAANYVNSMLAKTEAARAGCAEAVMLDPQGYVAEATSSNIFVVQGKKIYTTPLASVLQGITRDTLMTIAADQGLTIEERPISRDQLYAADEVFVCGTAAEVVALRELDGRRIGKGVMGPVTRGLQKAYSDVVHGKHPRSAEWLTYV